MDDQNIQNVVCPHCGKPINGDDLKAGNCGKCLTLLTVDIIRIGNKVGILTDEKLCLFKIEE